MVVDHPPSLNPPVELRGIKWERDFLIPLSQKTGYNKNLEEFWKGLTDSSINL